MRDFCSSEFSRLFFYGIVSRMSCDGLNVNRLFEILQSSSVASISEVVVFVFQNVFFAVASGGVILFFEVCFCRHVSYDFAIFVAVFVWIMFFFD